MPLILSDIITENVVLGIWKIEENESFFLNNIILNTQETSYLKSLKNQSRKLQWLSIRMLLNGFSHHYKTNRSIIYNQNGVPSLSTGENISISHTHEYSCLILGNAINVGIDIEKISERILKIKERMATAIELKYAQNNIEHLITLWAAKEAIYKLCKIPGLIFNRDINVDLSSIKKEYFTALVKYKYLNKSFTLKKLNINNHILVYVMDN